MLEFFLRRVLGEHLKFPQRIENFPKESGNLYPWEGRKKF